MKLTDETFFNTVTQVISEINPLNVINPDEEYYNVVSAVADSERANKSVSALSKEIKKAFLECEGKTLPKAECRSIAEMIFSILLSKPK